MLSKLEFYERGGKVLGLGAGHQVLQESIRRHFFSLGHRDVSITAATGGTLGVCFHLDMAGTKRFLKTHLSGEQACQNLTKEANILSHLYGGAVVLDRFEVQPDGDGKRLCLLMSELSHFPRPLSAGDAAAIVHSYIERLKGCGRAKLRPGWDLEHYIARGFPAIAALEDRGLVARHTGRSLERHLELLQYKAVALPRVLSHGDLGPKNIMTNGSQLLVVDWEDAFWGVDGYDYLYWLTFMDNRAFLRNSALGSTGLDPATERAILALVILLKSYLSVCAGTYLRNVVSIETRISEVLALP